MLRMNDQRDGSPVRVGFFLFFFFNDTATTEIYTLSLHDALPISPSSSPTRTSGPSRVGKRPARSSSRRATRSRSEEHTSELQSHSDLVCRLLLEKKKAISPSTSSLEFISTP